MSNNKDVTLRQYEIKDQFNRNVSDYLDTNSREKALGYNEALDFVITQIESMFTKQIGDNFVTSSPSNIATSLKLFLEELQETKSKAIIAMHISVKGFENR